MVYFTSDSSFERDDYDNQIGQYYGDYRLEDALTHEVMIVAYAYNKREPRFFTKYTAKNDPEIFDISIAEAVEASTAFPGYFKPKVIGNETLVDGAIIANNPAYYADAFAKHLYGKENIMTLSLGAGRPSVIPFSPDTQVNALTWIERLRSLILAAGMKTH